MVGRRVAGSTEAVGRARNWWVAWILPHPLKEIIEGKDSTEMIFIDTKKKKTHSRGRTHANDWVESRVKGVISKTTLISCRTSSLESPKNKNVGKSHR